MSKLQSGVALSLLINGEIDERVEYFKYLGITLDQNLNFYQHTLGVYKCCNRQLSVNLDTCLFSLVFFCITV